MLAEGESNLVLGGGVHNRMAPPVDFLAKAYLPLGIGVNLGSDGGMFCAHAFSLHSTTHLEILRRFLENLVCVVVWRKGPRKNGLDKYEKARKRNALALSWVDS